MNVNGLPADVCVFHIIPYLNAEEVYVLVQVRPDLLPLLQHIGLRCHAGSLSTNCLVVQWFNDHGLTYVTHPIGTYATNYNYLCIRAGLPPVVYL